MAHSALAIANAFLDIARAQGAQVDPMKLQKLVYYAHGWHLGLFGEPLIDEPVEAWKFGPVIQAVYHEFKSFGAAPITRNGTTFDLDALEVVEPRVEGDEDALSLIRKVWDEYGSIPSVKLSAMTHVPHGPWALARKGREQARSVTIPDDMIKQYFAELATGEETPDVAA